MAKKALLQVMAVFPSLSFIVGGLAVTFVLVFLYKLYKQRRMMMDLPGPPYHPIFGHLLVAAKMAQSLPPDVHPHHYWHWLRKEYDLGDFYYFDVWPMGPPTLVICEPDIAEQVTVKHSLDKHPMVKEYLKQHLGSENMAAANGAVWRKARTIYNPAFAIPHLMTVIPNIVKDVLVFHEILSELAENQEVFQMESTAMKLSFDVIGRLVLNLGLNSQRTSDELVDAFRKQLNFLSSANTWSSPLAGFNPIRQWKIEANSKVIHRYLGRILDNRFAQIDEDRDKKKGEGCCIMDKALYTYNTEVKGPQKGNKRSMDASFRKLAIDQIRTFVFAGHDTISTTISMIFYLLSKNQEVRRKACDELDEVFGPDIQITAAKIRQDPHILNKLSYNHAVMKEVLRLFPPANTVRVGSPSVNITDPKTGKRYPTHDWVVWPDSWVLGRDERYFPKPNSFIPERYLPDSPFPPIPVGAWRAFEKGPRNCIGSEFGTLEIKVVMSLTLRDFEFEPAYEEDAPKVDGDPCYQMLFGSAKPKGGVPGRVKKVAQRTVGMT